MNHSITIEDFSTICRVCLVSKNNMITFISPMIIYMLETCTSVQEISDNKMPQQICIDCYGQLKNAFHFKEQYLISVRILSEIILQSEKHVETENNTETIEIKGEYDTDEESDTKKDISNEIVTETQLDVKADTKQENIINSLNAESNNSVVDSDCEKCSDEDDDDTYSDSSNEEIIRKIEVNMMKRVQDANNVRANEEVKCETCGKKFKRKYLRRHRITHSEKKPYKCDICPAKFKHSFNLTRHKISLHSTGNESRELCFICGKFVKMTLSHHLQTHKQLNENERYKCDQCGRVYLRGNSLQIHMREKHPTDGTKIFPCKICNKIFTTKSSIHGHMVFMHSNSKRKHCQYCDKTYKTKSHLNAHVRSAHMNVRPHNCNVCGKNFFSTAILKNHMRTHTGERPFSCHICGKTFSLKCVLTTHMKVHSK